MTTLPPPSPLAAWLLACRPKTLPVSLSPVLVGSALAWQQQAQLHWLPLLAALLGAAFIQIGTNLFNDVGDFLRGTDRPGRLGPRRATAEGWLSPPAVARGAWTCFALAFLCGLQLVAHAGWPIVAIGLASLAAGWAYTGGPRPIAYGPLGEVFVFIFFGLVAVGGSHYVQTLTPALDALLVAAPVGLLAAAVISVNNYRDLDGDAASGKRTLAVRIGRPAMRRVYVGQLLLAHLCLLPLALRLGPGLLLPLLSLPLTLRLARRFVTAPVGPGLNALLAATAGLQLVFSLLLALALTTFPAAPGMR